MALPKGTKLELYLLLWDYAHNNKMDVNLRYHISQYIFNLVQKHTPKFSMNDAKAEYNEEIHRRFQMLSRADQTTVMIMDKTPEDAQYPIKAKT